MVESGIVQVGVPYILIIQGAGAFFSAALSFALPCTSAWTTQLLLFAPQTNILNN
jgi:hypothetical protein